MRKQIAVIASVIVTICFVYFLHAYFTSPLRNYTGSITNYPPKGNVVVAFGDSLVKGVGADDGKDFVSNLSHQISRPIINMGESGDTSAEGLARIDDVLARKPNIVLVLFGGNDAIRRVPIDQTFQNLGHIIKKLQDSGALVVLLGVKGGILTDPYASRFTDLAKTYKTAFVPNVMSGILGHDNLLFSDQIHPNTAGYSLISARIFPVLEKILSR